MTWRDALPNRATLASLGLGQLISLFVTGTGVASSVLAARGVNMSSSQSFLNYFLLLGFLVALRVRTGWPSVKGVLRDRWWLYLCLAVCDVEANFLVVLAYQYTSLSSVMLLDCFSIPCVMLLSRFLLQRRFSVSQIVGVLFCLGGIVALVLSDWLGDSFKQGASSSPIIGDFLCLASALLYAVSNVGQEAAVTQHSKIEFLGMLALFAAPLSLAQSAAIDHAAWASTVWTPLTAGLMAAFGVCLFAVYVLVPVMIERAGATFYNLSLLTSDVLAVVIGIYLFDYVPSLWYILGAVLIVTGLIVYNLDCKWQCFKSIRNEELEERVDANLNDP